MDDVSRRRFSTIIPAVTMIPADVIRGQSTPVPDVFPRHAPEKAREVVGASHAKLVRVKELVSVTPSLARASWDWGFGDWETALGAASHVGNKEIAAVLLAAGAHPTIFSAAMLGHLETVGDAEPRYPNDPPVAGDPDALHGTYVFGAGATDRLIVSNNNRGLLVMRREGGSDQ